MSPRASALLFTAVVSAVAAGGCDDERFYKQVAYEPGKPLPLPVALDAADSPADVEAPDDTWPALPCLPSTDDRLKLLAPQDECPEDVQINKGPTEQQAGKAGTICVYDISYGAVEGCGR